MSDPTYHDLKRMCAQLTGLVLAFFILTIVAIIVMRYANVPGEHVGRALSTCEQNGGLLALDRAGFDCMNGARFKYQVPR